MSEQLEPCPFCGSIPEVTPWHGGPKSKRMVACVNDDCAVSPEVTGHTPAKAIAAWNKRAAPPEHSDKHVVVKCAECAHEVTDPGNLGCACRCHDIANKMMAACGRITIDGAAAPRAEGPPPQLVAEIDALYEKAARGPLYINGARSRGFLLIFSESDNRQVGRHEHSEDADLHVALVNAWPRIRSALAGAASEVPAIEKEVM